MNIKAQETHRAGDRVHLNIIDDAESVIYDRYVDAAEWDVDPKAVLAQISDYLDNRPAEPEIVPTVNAKPVAMTDAEVATKLSEIASQKALDASQQENLS